MAELSRAVDERPRAHPPGCRSAVCLASRQSARLNALQAALNKQSSQNRKTPEQIDAAIRQLVSRAITTEGEVIDVFTAAGLPKPDI